MVGYDDFVKSWSAGAGQRAVDEGWGVADPLQEVRRRYGVGQDIADDKLLSYLQQNGLPDPKADKAQFGGILGDAAHGLASLADETRPVLLAAAGGAVAGGLGAEAGAASATDASTGQFAGETTASGPAGVGGPSMPPAGGQSPAMLTQMGLTETAPGVWTQGSAVSPGASPSPTGAPTDTTSSPSFLTAATPMQTLDPTTAAALGITPSPSGLVGAAPLGDTGVTASGLSSGGVDPGLGMGMDASTGQFAGETTESGTAGTPSGADGGDITSKLKKMPGGVLDWLTNNPATAGLLGISAYNALSTPKLPQAAQDLQKGATPSAAQANSVISQGGASAPAFGQQKSSIDASVNQQLEQQIRQIAQNAQNSGQGAFDVQNYLAGGAPKPGDSLAAIQQANTVRDKLESQRQQLYLQAQEQNVSDALKQLGISDQALSNVAAAQFAGDAKAQSTASETARLALLLQSLSNNRAAAL